MSIAKVNQILVGLSIFLSTIFCYTTVSQVNELSQRNIQSTFVAVNGGSGSIINSWSSNGQNYVYVLTAAHVIHKKEPNIAVFKEYGPLQGEVQELDKKRDFAIVKFKVPHKSRYMHVSRGKLSMFDQVYTIGRPNLQFWVTHGIVGVVNPDLIGHSSGAYFGVSGGPLLNGYGKQVGINLAIGVDSYHGQALTFMTMALPINSVYRSLGGRKFYQYFGV